MSPTSLRSPITQIRLKAESLMLGLSDTPEEQAADYQIIVRESARLSRLVDNVLDFSAIERGAKTYALVSGDLAATVSAAVEAVEGSAELVERQLFIRMEPDLPIVAHDEDAIAQCVINLLSNAAKYSEPDKPIRLEMAREGSGVVIRVIDQGIGIPESDVRQIFEPFFRGGDASVRRRKGTGIGLAITFYIVSAHKGSTSTWYPGLGKEVPSRCGSRPWARTLPKDKEHKMARILFVEDETEVLGTLTKYFERQGHTAHGAHRRGCSGHR